MALADKEQHSVKAVIVEIATPTVWACWLVTSVVVAFAGPFGTFDTRPFGWRLLYWGGLIAVAILVSFSLRVFWRRIINGRPMWLEDVCVAGSLAGIFAPCVLALNRYVGGPEAYEAMGFASIMAVVFAIAICTIMLRHTLIEGPPSQDSPPQRGADRLLNRLPEVPPDTQLWRISSDNHHIRIMTDTGQEHRLLMRLKDAVLETSPDSGVCIHRSHWVARKAVAGVKTVGGREVVALVCGTELPVGPKYADNLDFAKRINA